METSATVLQAIKKDDWMLSLDLKDAYFQVPIHPQSRKFLRVVWRGIVYQFRVLCFGLCTAPQVFTRVMAPVASILHSRGIRMLRYLDDWLILSSSEAGAVWAREEALHLCQQLGIVVNFEKSSLIPRQGATYLGMEIDSLSLKAFPTQKRLDALTNIASSFLARREQPALLWLRLIGHLSSLSHLVPGGRRRMRSLQLQLQSCWDRSTQDDQFLVPLSSSIREDLAWWTTTNWLLQGRSLLTPSPDLLLYADASKEGWGATIQHLQTSGVWTSIEEDLSINLLELRAIRLGLLQFEEKLQNQTVGILSDNRTAISYILKEGGTHSAALNREAQLTLQWAEDHNVVLMPQYVRGRDNVVADALSRPNQLLSTEWTLHQDVVDRLCHLWSANIDCFATPLNYRLQAFFCPYQDPMALATDAFLQSWDHMDLYGYPPINLVRKTLNKLKQSVGARMTLIAPMWPQKEWFPDLLAMLVDRPRRLPFRRDLLRQPHFHRFHLNLRGLSLIAWRLSSDSRQPEALLRGRQRTSPTLDVVPLS